MTIDIDSLSIDSLSIEKFPMSRRGKWRLPGNPYTDIPLAYWVAAPARAGDQKKSLVKIIGAGAETSFSKTRARSGEIL